MSDYLAREIEATSNIAVRYHAEVVDGERGSPHHPGAPGPDDRNHGDRAGQRSTRVIGAKPHTQWLPDEIVRDESGYVRTGGWAAVRNHMPGSFAVGDVRSGSVKRVASSVGDGAVAIRIVHEYLDDLHKD